MKIVTKTRGLYKLTKVDKKEKPDFLFKVFYNLGLSDIYQNYSAIEKEDLPIFYGLKKIEKLSNKRF